MPKISALTTKATPESADLVPIVDETGTPTTKKTTVGALIGLVAEKFKWHKAMDVDFRTEANQTLSADGLYTIAGRSWRKRNSANDRVAMAIVNGTGLVIAPGSTSNWDGGVYTMPLIEIPFSSISAGLSFGRAMRITAYISAGKFDTNFNFLSLGVSSQSGVAGYQLSRGYNSGQKVQAAIIGASSSSGSKAVGQSFSPVNDIVRILIPILGEANMQVLFAAHGNGGKEIPDEQYFEPITFIIDNSKDLAALTKTATSLVIGALRSGGTDTAFTATVARVVVEYLGETVADSEGVPGASLSGLAWRLPFISNLGGGSQSCPSQAIQTAVMSGAPGTTYNVTLRFQGAVERKAYTGGSNDGAYWQVGGTPVADAGQYNTYKLEISNPPQTYYLNRDAAVGPVVAIDYQKTVQIATGATVTLTADSLNAAELDHSVSVPGVTNPTQPYAGQFINATVVSIT